MACLLPLNIMNIIHFLPFFVYVSGFNIDTDFPIIYFDTNIYYGNEKSYFGHSVLLYKGGENMEPWIQIGAPRGHDPSYYNFTNPGLVYRCPIKKPCNLFKVDTKVQPDEKLGNNNRAYIPKKDKAWIGATMDIDTRHERIVICAPRWINKKREHYIQGACYWSNIKDNSTQVLLPLVNTKYEIKDNVYYYPMGQAGMSVHIPKTDDASVIMGAPGVYNWKGTPLMYQDDKLLSPINNSVAKTDLMYYKLIVPEVSKIKEVFSFGYLGYSISSGHFFSQNKISYVAGAPRSSSYRGQVLIFDFPSNNDGDLIIKQTRQGDTMGEYFGAVIAVADINGDHLDDLIVGAPHYSTKYDEGRIYVFYGNRRENLLTPDQGAVFNGNWSGGQFGSAIQALGDINDDDCEDIAVGAPYENDHHGVVYIYNGARKGPALKLSQRIEGKNLYFNLRGFGISFSRPTDIDKNHFNDIAVGSFLSDNAVILRVRPIVILTMSLRSFQSRLERNTKEFIVNTCFSYLGRNLADSINITRKLEIDRDHRRAYVVGYDINSIINIQNITLRAGIRNCYNISIGIKTKQTDRNVIDPISIIMSQDLIETKPESVPILINTKVTNVDNFCNTCPIVDKQKSLREFKREIPYALNCGSDEKCESDLKVTARFVGLKNKNFVIGKYKTIPLEIIISNSNEPAYLTVIEVMLPENVYLSAKPAECDEMMKNNTIVVFCHVDNPLEADISKTITLEIDMEAVMNLKQQKLSFEVIAKSRSDEINKTDNNVVSELKLVVDADMEITGKTEKNVYFFGDDPLVNATHIYEVQKMGVSPLNEFALHISIPVAIKTDHNFIQFMSIHKPLGYQSQQLLSCHWPDPFIKDTVVLEVENENQNINRSKRSVDRDPNASDAISFENIAFLNCSMAEVVCKVVSCTVGPFRQHLRGASLQVRMVLNLTDLKDTVLKDKQGVYLSTDGHVKEIEGQINAKTRVSSAFIKESTEIKVASWIVATAIAAGILILLLIVLGLVKAGFFERKQKAELEALKQAEVEEEFDVREPSTECVSENEEQ